MAAALHVGLALLAGVCLAVQVGVNGVLRSRMGSPVLSTLTSFASGTAALLLVIGLGLALGRGEAARAAVSPQPGWAGAPWWAWTGGLLGAGYVMLSITFAPRLGAAGWVGVMVSSQIVASVVLDHFGLLGFAPRAITPARVAGVALLVAGVALVLQRRF